MKSQHTSLLLPSVPAQPALPTSAKGLWDLAGTAASCVWVTVSPGQAWCELLAWALEPDLVPVSVNPRISSPDWRRGSDGGTGAAGGLVSPHPHLLLPGSSLPVPGLFSWQRSKQGHHSAKERPAGCMRLLMSLACSCTRDCPWHRCCHPREQFIPDGSQSLCLMLCLMAATSPVLWSTRSPLQTSPDELQAPSHGLRVTGAAVWDPWLWCCGDVFPLPCTPHWCL